ncbi:pilus assembly protein TadG-related protein [Tropicimonas sp. TH_r6]|uniref:TadE/TadG family type IV pilus assembly protein n=1 Tax=Tropicimonas sp. TH_r6 TaxID=3082085 RepID=UPI0029532042|nr:pilus assembly protein TadG-related protein [Tropicimonas sp. TH_r6]MDV7142649.1 pilus assembly protein TadG-related protein [Tropicimonas sp. TH_r6]
MPFKIFPRSGSDLSREIRAFGREEDGGMIVFSLFIVVCMLLAVGASLDTARFEYTRSKLQHTLDRAVLAAANLEQVLDPQEVVEDYFAKAGLSDQLISVTVSQGVNYRTVSAVSEAQIDTMFMDMVGIETLSVPAVGEANETLADIEVALVLDNSGSMRTVTDGQTRLARLQEAAKEFVESVARDGSDSTDDGTTSISIIPFAEQVTVGETILQHYNASDEHDKTHCVTFEDADFRSTTLTQTQELNRMAYFDPYNSGWTAYDSGICDTTGNREIAPWSTDAEALKLRIDDMYHSGWTSIDVGTKWGVTMLDPSSQPVLTKLIASGDVDAELAGQPFDYSRDNTMKILVVMSDGANTYQRDIASGYRSGNSPLYIYNGDYSYEYDDDGKTMYYNRYSRYDKKRETSPIGGSNARRLTWPEVWADMTVDNFASELMSRALHSGSSSYGDYYYDKIIRGIGETGSTSWSGNEKNPNTSDICSAAKDKGILIFSIGMDTNDSTADMTLEDCASLPTYYYDVQSVDISNAFASIALQINQLRLTQ